MSDLMLIGVLRMPITSQSNELALEQYIQRGRQAADLIEQLKQRNAELERDWNSEHYHRRAVDEENGSLKKERDELAATVERLRNGVFHFNRSGGDMNPLLEAVSATPQSNLNAIKREAYIDGAMTFRAFHSPHEIKRHAHAKYPTTEGE